jgi:catechol 2,3-dioxygenase-like lactoylglutathione lyase family enzyme
MPATAGIIAVNRRHSDPYSTPRRIDTRMNTVAPYEVGIVARDVDALVRFYVDVLGLTVYSDVSAPMDMGAASGLSPLGYRVVRLSTRNGQRIKIARAPDTVTSQAEARFPMQSSGGFYVTFLVTELASLWTRLREAGVALCSERIVDVRPGVALFLARDPEGNFLEFVEYADLGAYLAPPDARA